MSRDNVEAVCNVYAALSRDDLEATITAFSPEGEVDWSRAMGPYRGVYRGHDRMREFWSSFREAVEQLTFEVERTVDAGPHVVASVSFRIRGRGSGAEVVARGHHVWKLHDGKALRVTLFQTEAEALEAAGLRK